MTMPFLVLEMLVQHSYSAFAGIASLGILYLVVMFLFSLYLKAYNKPGYHIRTTYKHLNCVLGLLSIFEIYLIINYLISHLYYRILYLFFKLCTLVGYTSIITKGILQKICCKNGMLGLTGLGNFGLDTV